MPWIPKGNFKPLCYRPGGVGNWSGHLSFASDLIACVQPRLLVELGTHWGESYFGFCQAVAENNLPCLCYAVDTWVGEMHSGYYDENVYSAVSAHNNANYAAFSYLLRTSFDEALAGFSDDTIDILHIDGLHTYEAASHDFYSWLPKVKPGGIILIHDIAGRHDSFGIWKLWDELADLGDRFAFTHSWGLGVFRRPGTPLPAGMLSALFQSSPEEQEHIRHFYSLCASKLNCDSNGHSSPTSKIRAQVYPFGSDGYSPERCHNADFDAGLWQHLVFELSSGLGNGPLRIDLTSQPALIDIAAITIRKAVNQEILWTAAGPAAIEPLELQGTMKRFEDSNEAEFSRFISFGSDPQLLLPALDPERFDQPLLLEVWVRVQTEISSLLPLLEAPRAAADLEKKLLHTQATVERLSETNLKLSAERDRLIRDGEALTQERKASIEERQTLIQERETLIQERDSASTERDLLVTENRKLQRELYVCRTDLARRNEDNQRLQAEVSEWQEKLDTLEETLRVSEAELHQQLALSRDDVASAAERCQRLESTLNSVLTSRSWRITAPFRDFMLRIRGSGN